MKKHLITAVLYTAVTAVLFGIVYPLAVTGVAGLLFPRQANGSLIAQNGS
jgi:K+-transporting ATPase ATPase C chain